MLFNIVCWKNGKLESPPPDVFFLSAETLAQAEKEYNRLIEGHEYYIVELSIVIEKTQIARITNRPEPMIINQRIG